MPHISGIVGRYTRIHDVSLAQRIMPAARKREIGLDPIPEHA